LKGFHHVKKINSAADDPAGLAISTKMKAQN
jgi:flagellin-like hook-associated protein FlgL